MQQQAALHAHSPPERSKGRDRPPQAARSPEVPCVIGERFWEAGGASAEGGSGAELSGASLRHGTAEYARLMHVKVRSPKLHVSPLHV